MLALVQTTLARRQKRSRLRIQNPKGFPQPQTGVNDDGLLLLREVTRRSEVMERFAQYFSDHRDPR
ncbi:MAG: hypothetical protein JO166_09885 [Deltaproteobacteria bacterium]|nr:hypothetical protein [Deltaproteobacteria bacterium]